MRGIGSKGVAGRADRNYDFGREKWAAALANINADNARADAAFAAGRGDEGRQIRRSAAMAADAAVSDFITSHGEIRVIKKVFEQDPSGAWIDRSTTVIDPTVLPQEAQDAYKALLGTRDALRRQVITEAPPETPAPFTGGARPPAGGTPSGGTKQIARIGEKGSSSNMLYDASKEADFDPNIPAYNPDTGMMYRNWNGKGQWSHDGLYRGEPPLGSEQQVAQTPNHLSALAQKIKDGTATAAEVDEYLKLKGR
jgi:hypothetical protein